MLYSKLSNIGFIKGKYSLGLTFHLITDDEVGIDFVLLSKSKNIVSIEKSASNLVSIEALLEVIEKKYPIHLNVIGKGVIHRLLDEQTIKGLTDTEVINKILPNGDVEDFVLQKKSTSKGVYVSLIRKSLLNDITGKFVLKGFHIIDIILGPFSINNIADLADYSEYLCKNFSINIQNNSIESFEITTGFSEIYYQIGDENIHSQHVFSFASAFIFYRNPTKNPIVEQLGISPREFIYMNATYVLGWFILISTFMVLMANYIMYERYNKKYNALSYEFNNRITDINNLKELSENLKLQEKFVMDNGLYEMTKFSFYADRLILLMPEEIVLKSMDMNPLISEIKKDKELEINKNKIIIFGSVSKNKSLNTWIKEIEKEEWVKKIEIVKFSQSDAGLKAEFNIEININNNVKF